MSDVGDEVAQAFLRLAETSIRLSINSVKQASNAPAPGENDKAVVQYDFKNEEIRNQIQARLTQKGIEVAPTAQGAGIVFYKSDLQRVAQTAMECAQKAQTQTALQQQEKTEKQPQKDNVKNQSEKQASSPRLDAKIKEAKNAAKHTQKDKSTIKKEMQRNLTTPTR